MLRVASRHANRKNQESLSHMPHKIDWKIADRKRQAWLSAARFDKQIEVTPRWRLGSRPTFCRCCAAYKDHGILRPWYGQRRVQWDLSGATQTPWWRIRRNQDWGCKSLWSSLLIPSKSMVKQLVQLYYQADLHSHWRSEPSDSNSDREGAWEGEPRADKRLPRHCPWLWKQIFPYCAHQKHYWLNRQKRKQPT